ncbi:hypothetical protein PYW08_006461 [Mythimna loreyi]|uniref:Uncharacterized protein n=1 Tax=Mythimna loreyi TaxID=667449 RepID=A0ACC2QNS1_9NEOP|nr:hypothetical protein PYW08_006461 [Mythimna loreyi]
MESEGFLQDEDTNPSNWVPSETMPPTAADYGGSAVSKVEPGGSGACAGSSKMTVLLQAAKRTVIIDDRPAKRPCLDRPELPMPTPKGKGVGALVDSYDKKLIVLKLKSPEDVVKDVLGRLDFAKMGTGLTSEIKKTLGGIEVHYQKQFIEILGTYQELIVTPYPVELQNQGNGQLLDITGLRRQKRSWWRVIMAFLRAVRPVARNAGKLTKYGKFIKGLKYAGYAASAGVFAYEIAEVFGAVPDLKYQEVTRQLNELHDGRVKDLEVLKNITLITVNTNNNMRDIGVEVSNVLSEAHDRFEIMIKVSQVFGSYMQQLSNSLLLLLQGNIPSNLISLELQRDWLERQLPSPLLNHALLPCRNISSEASVIIM